MKVDLSGWYRLAHRDRRLAELAGRFRSVKPPGDDVGAQKSLARWLGRPGPLDYDGISSALEKWRPYAGMIYFHLLLDGLAQAGSLDT